MVAPVMLEGTWCALTVLRDLSDRDRVQKQMHDQRLASIGATTAGLVHDLRNPLSGVRGNADLAAVIAAETCPGSELARVIDEIRDSTTRTLDILNTMVRHARGHSCLRSELSLDELLDEALVLGGSALRGRVQVARRIPSETAIWGSRDQIVQVLVTLLVNASQASSDPLLVTVTASRLTSGCVRIEVRDSGPGIPACEFERIFERFYTTKAPGEGAGLGLAISHTIVSEHGGRISAANHLEGGAVFTILLPSSDAASAKPCRSEHADHRAVGA